MLSTIPRRILRSTAIFSVPAGVDRYQKPMEPSTYTVHNVHLQGDYLNKRSTNNTEVTLSGVLFVDARISTPALDYEALQRAANAAGGEMTVSVYGKNGALLGNHTVVNVDALPGDEDNLHHWELGLV